MKRILILLACACLLCAALCPLSYATDEQTSDSTAETTTQESTSATETETNGQTTVFTQTTIPQSVSYYLINNNGKHFYGAGSLNIQMPEQYNATSYALYWGDASGQRLMGYDALYTGQITGVNTYTMVSDSFAIPAYTKCILLYTYSEEFGQSEKPYRFDLPDLEPSEFGTKKLEFAVVSDLHIGSDEQADANFSAVLKDIMLTSPQAAGIFITGDAVTSADVQHYEQLQKLWKEVSGAPKLYRAIGERELLNKDTLTYDPAQYSANLKTFLSYVNTTESTKPTTPYYSMKINGYLMIFIGADSYQNGQGTYSEAQLTWLRSTLEKTDKYEPVFIFMHQPMPGTVTGTTPVQEYTEISNADRLTDILKQHPNAVVFTGHTQMTMSSARTSYIYPNGARYFNSGAVASLKQEIDGTVTQFSGSQGYIVTVYEDYVMIRGRNFSQGGQWISDAYFLFTLKPAEVQTQNTTAATKTTKATTAAEEEGEEEKESKLRELALPVAILGVMGIVVFLWVFRKPSDQP